MKASCNALCSLCPDLDRVEQTLRTKYWCWHLLEPGNQAHTIISFLRSNLAHISEESWMERLDFGGIFLNGREITLDQPLVYPAKVEYYEPKFDICDASSVFATVTQEHIIYADDDICVAYKPPRLPSMPAKEQRHFSLKTSLEKLLKCTVHMPSRLDMSAQGILVVSLSERAHGPLQRAFELRRVKKRYRLATAASCAWHSHTEDTNITRDPSHPVLRTISRDIGQAALTHFEHLYTTGAGSIVQTVLQASPVSGRTHQIRVHAAHAGIPIVGDNFYGGANACELHLVSYELELEHPTKGSSMLFTAPTSLTPPWTTA
jgi:tRNA pseudouridine32 synthase/23S rRNA pseudouridine746 synthase